MNKGLKYQFFKPDRSIGDFVAGFWSLQNQSDHGFEGIVIPTGYIDLFFSRNPKNTLDITLIGLETKPKTKRPSPIALFAISFKPLATEYIFHHPIAGLLDSNKALPNDFWNFIADDLNDFDTFCQKISDKIQSLLPEEIDERKRRLFELIFETNGAIPVNELSQKVYWSARQINRYFNRQFDLSLKAYCNIIRFRASFRQIREGELFPKQNFTDQSHFIKASKKLSGVSPKELYRNQNDRFIQFSFPLAD